MLNDRDSNPPRSSTPRLCRRTFLCRGRVGSASAPSTTSSQQQPESWTRIKITPNLTALDSQRQLSVKKDQKAHSSKKTNQPGNTRWHDSLIQYGILQRIQHFT